MVEILSVHNLYVSLLITLFIFQGARHPFAQAVGRNIANPTAILLSSANMLKHMHLDFHSQLVEDAVCKVIKAGKVRTPDMGGYSTTSEFTKAVIDALH